jgi:hypothetical protein
MFELRNNMSLAERKSALIQEHFVATADADYLTARWAYDAGCFYNFCWSASQCVEKYLKAAILYDGRSTKGFGHNLNKLYPEVSKIDPALMKIKILMPLTTGKGRELWDGKSMLDFVDYLNLYGSADGRYALEGIYINGPVIHPLDSLCVLVRKLIRLQKDQLFPETIRPIKPDHDWSISAHLPLERLFAEQYQAGESHKLRWTFRNMNFAFFDDRVEGETVLAQREATFGGQISFLSPLRNHLVRLAQLDDSEENIRITNELRTWVEANIQLSDRLRGKLGFPQRQDKCKKRTASGKTSKTK